MKERIALAHKTAKDIRAKGETVVVCPAIKARNHKGNKAKCGDCTACANKNVKVVLYALH